MIVHVIPEKQKHPGSVSRQLLRCKVNFFIEETPSIACEGVSSNELIGSNNFHLNLIFFAFGQVYEVKDAIIFKGNHD